MEATPQRASSAGLPSTGTEQARTVPDTPAAGRLLIWSAEGRIGTSPDLAHTIWRPLWEYDKYLIRPFMPAI
jgi:hypothetical protein